MEDIHGKEISFQYVTVKVPGQRPKGSRTVINSTKDQPDNNNAENSSMEICDEVVKKPDKHTPSVDLENNDCQTISNETPGDVATPINRKRPHSRLKSSSIKSGQDLDGML